MAFYRQVGEIPPKRHTQFRRPDGKLYYEELVGEEGFSSDSSLLYHRGVPPGEEHKAVDPVTGRRLVLGNADVRISYAVSSLPSPYYRNATGDECVYVERGAATVETVFGALEVGQGDYVILPRATTHRWIPTGDEPLRTYAIEANSHIAPPKRYLSRYGQMLEHAPTWRSTSSTAATAPAGSPARSTSFRSTRSTSSAGTAASTRTPSTSPTTCRSPARSTSRRRPTRSSKATTS